MLSRHSHLAWLLSYFKISCHWLLQTPPRASGTEHEAVNRSENSASSWGATARYLTGVAYAQCSRP